MWVGLEWLENEENRRPTVAAAAAFVGSIRLRPTANGHEISRPRSPSGGALTWVARVSEGGQKRLPRLKPDWPENGSKRPSSGSMGLGEFF